MICERYGETFPADPADLDRAADRTFAVRAAGRPRCYFTSGHLHEFTGLDDTRDALHSVHADGQLIPLINGLILAPRLTLGRPGATLPEWFSGESAAASSGRALAGSGTITVVVARPDEIPMPAAIAARPRDDRGYPVPAITPWEDGRPVFAQQGSFRTVICLAERRCTVCGTKIPPGPVYRPVDSDTAGHIALARAAGKLYFNAAPATEAPGHRSCMIYSAAVCPYLASPGARRAIETHAGPELLPKGDPRGTSAAVAGYDGYTWTIGEHGFEITFGQPVELLSYAEGADLIGELAAEIARETAQPPPCPAYLLKDDASARQTATKILAGSDGSPAPAGQCRREQARKNRRKAARSARRRNR